MNGFLLVNKPVGIPSFKVVSRLRFLLKEKRIGFAGTLDPFASGLLILAVGREFTRQLDLFLNLPKTYLFTWVLGIETDTLDRDGAITQTKPYLGDLDKIPGVLEQFKGALNQVPPAFSAKKINGVRAYHLARQGLTPELAPSTIHIHHLETVEITPGDYPIISLEMTCSKGTYVRSLVRDVSHALGSVGYVRDLCRTQIGPYVLENAVPFDELSPDTFLSYRFLEAPCPS
jgi:tRNA pseudouridine55 synthase